MADRESFLALEGDEPIFTYMKFRIDRDVTLVALSRLLEEPNLDPRPSYNLVIEDAEGFCGWAGIDSIQGTDSGQFGWYLRSDRWGRGYATEATQLLLDFSFSVLRRATMWATADPDNLASLRVLEKSGLASQVRRILFIPGEVSVPVFCSPSKPGSGARSADRRSYRRVGSKGDVPKTSPLPSAPATRPSGSAPSMVVLHMIEETARHAGHLDLARELLDGKVRLGGR